MFSERGSRLTRARSAAQHFETSACNSRIFCKVLGWLPLGKLWGLEPAGCHELCRMAAGHEPWRMVETAGPGWVVDNAGGLTVLYRIPSSRVRLLQSSLPPTFCPHHRRMIVQTGTSQA